MAQATAPILDSTNCDISRSLCCTSEAHFRPYQSARVRRMILPAERGANMWGGGNFSECSEARLRLGRSRGWQ
jgi:hypothetical protein